MEHDWATDYVIDYVEDGQRHRTIWPGFTYEDAKEEFQRGFPERRVIAVDLQEIE